MRPQLTPLHFERLILNMKLSAFLVLLATAAAGSAEIAVVPERFSADRYDKLKNDPPFAVKTPDEKAPEVKIDWAENLYLSGASKFTENGVEKDWVYINHKSDPTAAFQLYGTEPNGQGIQIVKLDWHPENPTVTKVTLKKGSEFATLERDKAAFSAPPMPQQGIPQPRPGQPNPGMIPNATGAIRPPNAQPPRTPQIPRPNNVIPAPQPTYPQATQGTQQNQGNDRRRIRVIGR
jgi:hypothetical protein